MPLSVVVKCFKVMTIASLIIDDILRKMPDLLFPKGERKKIQKIKVDLLPLAHW